MCVVYARSNRVSHAHHPLQNSLSDRGGTVKPGEYSIRVYYIICTVLILQPGRFR